MTIRTRKYVIFAVFAFVSVFLDQWTKVLARQQLRPAGWRYECGESVWGEAPRARVVIDGFFNLRYSENCGVAFGMLQKLPTGVGRTLLTLVALGALVLVLYYLRKSEDRHLRMHVALGLVGGGALGNLIDRILFGKVSDFIVWHYHHHEWPAFNIADAALVVGVGLMALDMLLAPKAEPAKGG
jgi:signal peptidase II